MIKMFFPKVGIPSRTEVQDQINNVYPGARLTYFRVSDYEPGQPLLKVAEERSGEDREINETVANDAAVSGEVTQETEGTLDEDDMKGMSVKSGHKRPTKSGAGMTKKGVEKYRRDNPGSKLQTAVTGKVKPGSKDAKRRKSFCARSRGWTGERGKAARRRWKC